MYTDLQARTKVNIVTSYLLDFYSMKMEGEAIIDRKGVMRPVLADMGTIEGRT